MRRQRLLVVILAVVTALVLVTGTVAAKATKTEFTGVSTAAVIDPGVMTYPDGNVHIRGMVLEVYLEADDTRVEGTETVVGNANLDANGAGPVWGTSHIEVDYGGGGVWEGTFTGKFYADGTYSHTYVAHGIEGSVEGLEMRGTVVFPPDPTQPGISTGTILDPHGY